MIFMDFDWTFHAPIHSLLKAIQVPGLGQRRPQKRWMVFVRENPTKMDDD